MRTITSPMPTMPRPRRSAAAPLRWFVPAGSWITMVATWGAIVFFGGISHPRETLWIWVGLATSVVLVWHLFVAMRRVPWIPGLITLTAAVQWVLAPYSAYFFNIGVDRYGGTMSVPPDQYFGFMVPALLALIGGLWFPVRHEARSDQHAAGSRVRLAPRLKLTCELMVWAGIVNRILEPLWPMPIRFAMLLLAELSYVGAFAMMLADEPKAWLRLAALLAVQFVLNARTSMFLQFVIWSACAAAIVIYHYRPRTVWILSTFFAGIVLVATMNAYKRYYRNDVIAQDMSDAARTEAVSSRLTEIATDPSTLLSNETIAVNLGRLNQGSIITHILAWVPDAEPYAHGETIANGLRAALLPRVLDPNKYVAGGSEYFERFTGLKLIDGTSMNLSIPGEMYANFGYAGGVFGVFVYGLAIGWIYRFILRRARSNPLWWAWAPYLLVVALSAEDGFGETINRLSKSMLVMALVVWLVPAWRTMRSRRPRSVVAMPNLNRVAIDATGD